jgi:protocatechuate 3,4-dioxygenase beta subunit
MAGLGPIAQVPGPLITRTVTGRVADARDNRPLRRARVIVTSGDRQVGTVFTDDDGRFAIGDVPVTAVTLRVTKGGYVAGLSSISAESGSRVDFALGRSASVTGRVTDLDGAPVSQAYVTGRLIPSGRDEPLSPSTPFFAQTDRLGEYRLAGLAPGRYEIRGVRVPPELRAAGTKVEQQLFGPQDVLDTSRAATMTLTAGDEVRDLNFTIPDATETCLAGFPVRPSENINAATIVGRVTSATGDPLVCASVRIIAPKAPVSQVYTDRQGWYWIEGLPAGSFHLEARKSGHITLQHGQRAPSDAAVPVALGSRQRREGVDFVLPREGVIRGTVFDEHGEPIEGIPVWAFQFRREYGRPVGAVSSTVPRLTDDRGQYSLAGLRPGTYVVAAMARGMVSTDGLRNTRGYASIYYPGSPDASGAQHVVLDGSRDAERIDISLVPAFMATVTGVVIDAAGRPFSGSVFMGLTDRSGAASFGTWSGQTDANGAFTIRNVPRGDYAVKAPGPPGEIPPFGMQYVTVIDADPPPVRIVLSDGATLEGRLVLEAAPDINLAGFSVSVVPATIDYAAASPVFLRKFGRNADGTFRVVGAYGPSRLLITELPACAGCYLKSARVNGVEASDTPFDFGMKGGLYRDVEVVVSDAGAAIEGRVTDTRDATVAVFTVVAIPAYPELRYPGSRHVKTARSSPDGRFRVTGLPPGDYFVLAVNRLDSVTAETSDPAVLEELADRGQRVTLAERERRTLDLRLIRR